MNVRALLETTNTQGQPVTLRATDWLDSETSERELQSLYEAFTASFSEALSQVTKELGAPLHTFAEGRSWLASWYPEAFQFAGWPYKDGILMLAAEHHDRETPIVLHFGYVPQEEIDARSE
jgi:hypothetical protein